MKRIIFSFQSVLLALAATGHSQTLRDVVANTNGALVAPTNFFAASGVPTLAGSNAFTGTNTFSRLNIGSTNYGWRYATNNGGQIELAFPGGVAAWYQTGSPAIPYMYFAGTVQADTIVGAISATSINAEALGGQIPGSVVGQSMSPTVQNWLAWENHSQAAGVVFSNTGPLLASEPVPENSYYFPAAFVTSGGADYVNTLDGVYLNATNATTALGAPRLDAATNNFTGSAVLGDAAGDTVTVNAGTFTAPNATNTGSTAVANVGALDGRLNALIARKTNQTDITNSSTPADISPVLALRSDTTYRVQALYITVVNSGTMGVRARINFTGTVDWTMAMQTLRALNGSNWAWTPGGSAIQTVNQTSDFLQGNATLYGFSVTTLLRTTSSGNLSFQAAQTVAETNVLSISSVLLVAEPVAN